jgi:hypothetical protein
MAKKAFLGPHMSRRVDPVGCICMLKQFIPSGSFELASTRRDHPFASQDPCPRQRSRRNARLSPRSFLPSLACLRGCPTLFRMKPFFIPLKRKYWEQFAAGTKTVEWRAYGARFNERVLLSGRPVVLSCGYTGPRLYAIVTQLEIVDRAGAPPGARAIYPQQQKFAKISLELSVPRTETSVF